MIHFSGVLHERTGSWATSWMVIMLVISGLLFLAGIYHSRFLPPGAKAPDAPKSIGDAMRTFEHTFAPFFRRRASGGCWPSPFFTAPLSD